MSAARWSLAAIANAGALLATGAAAQTAAPSAAPASPAAADRADIVVADWKAVEKPDEIVVTAQGRRQALASVPLAVTVVTADRLERTGAHDLRELTQLTPSLYFASSSTEAQGGSARIRGVGTVGDNPGLESSVATFVDGVYRARSGTALTELGPLDRIEVLRGPQGTLFGRNASAGLISIVTAAPQFNDRGDAAFTIGNYGERRAELGFTGPIDDMLAYRLDGVWTRRRGFIEDVTSGRHINNRDRWLARGQLLFQPRDGLSLRVIADYARRNEECCAGVYLPAASRSLDPATGAIAEQPSTIAALIRGFGGTVLDDPFKRKTALTPGQSYRADVRDGGLSAQLDADLGWAKLTAISAWRDWRYVRGQDADFNSLDLLVRADNGDARQRFDTLSQEVRLNGKAFGGRLDWLVGGYIADERLHLADNLAYGTQFGSFFSCLVAAGAGGLALGQPGCLAPTIRSTLSQLQDGQALLAGLDRLAAISSAGNGIDRYRQNERNAALFTHDVLKLTDRLSLTAGLRWTDERKSLVADLNGSPVAAGTCLGNAAALTPLEAASEPALYRSAAAQIIGFSCVIAPIVSADLSDHRSEGRLSGTAALSWQATDRLMLYGSWSRGYKSFGYNLDRAALNATAPSANALRFKAETVEAIEAGAKYHVHAFDLSLAAFQERFSNFQLNLFSGSNFIVANIEGCTKLAGGPGSDSDNIAGNSACVGHRRPGVVSRGLEGEAAMRPLPDLSLDGGLTYAHAHYADDLTGVDGTALPTGFFGLPGHQLSSAPRLTGTGSVSWTPAIGGSGLRALGYADVRYQGRVITGSDLDPEKGQSGVAVVNARIGLTQPRQGWSIELWAQNLFDANYIQVGFDAPAQPGGAFNTIRGVKAGYQAVASQLFGAFLAEPRTWGLTLRTRL